MRAAALPDDLEMILDDYRLSVSAALLSIILIVFNHDAGYSPSSTGASIRR